MSKLLGFYASKHQWVDNLSYNWLIIMQASMCDSFLWVLCGCSTKFSRDTEPKRGSLDTLCERELMSVPMCRHIRLLWELLQHVDGTQLWFLFCNQLQSGKSQRCWHSEYVPKRIFCSSNQHNFASHTTNLHHHNPIPYIHIKVGL